jgi:hypothetical protein
MNVGTMASAVHIAGGGPVNYEFIPLTARYVLGVNHADLATARYTGASVNGTASALSLSAAHTYSDLEQHKYIFAASFASFDTSSLAGKTITAASVEINVNTGVAGTNCQVRAYNFGGTVDVADFHAVTETIIASGSATPGGLRTIAGVGSNLINAVNKTGTTYLMLTEPTHTWNTAPLAENTSFQANFNSIKLKVTAQ